ncbi:ABC transporter substrate-binding protein [Phyllobacterium sp. SB3]|uniref:ABC transporter substrate-binding protein n=1 Tax=Phyllobacterium sp. SB3 TaxID=3156073 RepID=UPI0032AF24AB
MLKTINISRRTILLAGGAAALAGRFPTPAIAQNKPIQLGWIVSLTGVFSNSAQAQDFGAKAAIEQINESGGIEGRKVELVTRDSAADPTKAVNYAKELIYNTSVDAICGPTNSGEALPTLGVVAAANRIHVVLGSVDDLINPAKYPLAFRQINTNSQWVKASTIHAVQKLNKKKVAIICDTTGYGQLSAKVAKAQLQALGMEPAYEALLDPNQTDATDQINAARAAGADAISMWSNASGIVARVLNARGEQKWDVPVVAHPAALYKQVGDLLTKPAYWENVYSPAYDFCIVDQAGKLPASTQAFFDRYKGQYEQFLAAGMWCIFQGQAGPLIYASGVKAAGNLDAAAIAQKLNTGMEVGTPSGIFKYSDTDHNGYADSNLVMVAASSLQPNGGYRAA